MHVFPHRIRRHCTDGHSLTRCDVTSFLLVRSNLNGRLETVHDGHLAVHEDGTDLAVPRLHNLEGLRTVAGDQCSIAKAIDNHPLHQVSYERKVIDNEDVRSIAARHTLVRLLWRRSDTRRVD